MMDLNPSVPAKMSLDMPHCVFAHMINGTAIYVGVDTVPNAFVIKNISRNVEWLKLVKANNGNFHVSIVGLFKDRYKAIEYHQKYVNATKPHCNQYRQRVYTNIQCIDDGRTYANAAQAAAAYGISRSAVSNHLNERPGYQTVHGMTFKRIPRFEGHEG